ncbi:MAG: pentapeptide repeat-containing protein [Pseudomonadota bacterium]
MSEKDIGSDIAPAPQEETSYLPLIYRFGWFLVPFWVLFTGYAFYTLLLLMLGEVPDSGEDLRWRALSVAAMIATIGGLVGAPLALIRVVVAERQTRAAEAQRETAEQGLITDRFTKAVEQLGAEKVVYVDGKANTEPNLEVRLGALYALERIAEDSERDHIPIMETLCAYIRENSKAREPADFPEPEWEGLEDYSDEAAREAHLKRRRKRFGTFFFESKAWLWVQHLPVPRADIQAAMRIIGRRSSLRLAFEKRKKYRLDLRAANLQRCDLYPLKLGPALLNDARLEGAQLARVQMDGASLTGAKMQGANLYGTMMGRVDLEGSEMEGANLHMAQMEGADLRGAMIGGADFSKVEMGKANLNWARMEAARFSGAIMEGARLRRATMEGADLAGAMMGGADFHRAMMDGVNLDNTNLEGASLYWAKTQGTDLRTAVLKSADLTFWECRRTNARSADFSEAQNMSQEQVNSLFGDSSTRLPPLDANGKPLVRTTLLDREPLSTPRDPDPEYEAWLDAGAPPGTPITD